MQLVGTPQRTAMDLNALSDAGVRLIGRLGAIRDGIALFSGSLPNVCTLADLKLRRLLDLIDEWADTEGLDPAGKGARPEATRVPDPPPLDLDLRSGQIKTILWATGYRPDYAWLDFPVLDRKGRIRHDGGVVTEIPGLYLMGMPFLRRRKSSLIDGADADSTDLIAHLEGFLAGSPS
jgi:putative flavoprotein involved in K+ transport